MILVTASNHPEVLDRAAGRRFQVHVTLPAPSQAEIRRFVEQQAMRGHGFGVTPETIAKTMAGASYSEVEDLLLDIRRRYVLGLPDVDLKRTAQERLDRWRKQ